MLERIWHRFLKMMEYPNVIYLLLFVVLIAQLYFIKIATDGNARIESCTDPKGACYQQAQKSQVQIITNLNLVSVYASFCASRIPPPVSAEEVQKCVDAELHR